MGSTRLCSAGWRRQTGAADSAGPVAPSTHDSEGDRRECDAGGTLPRATDLSQLRCPRADQHLLPPRTPYLAAIGSASVAWVLDGLLPHSLLRAGVPRRRSPLPKLQAPPLHLPKTLTGWSSTAGWMGPV